MKAYKISELEPYTVILLQRGIGRSTIPDSEIDTLDSTNRLGGIYVFFVTIGISGYVNQLYKHFVSYLGTKT